MLLKAIFDWFRTRHHCPSLPFSGLCQRDFLVIYIFPPTSECSEEKTWLLFLVLLMLFRRVTKQLFISTMTPVIRCRNTSSAVSPSVVFNLTMNDKRQSPVYNVIMWACLFLGQGVQVCLYCQEWYAQKHCPRTGVRTRIARPASCLARLPDFPIVFKHAIFYSFHLTGSGL